MDFRSIVLNDYGCRHVTLEVQMRAIIIQEKDCKALLDSLELEKHNDFAVKRKPDEPWTAEEMHRRFHFVVVKWLQEQGSDGLQR